MVSKSCLEFYLLRRLEEKPRSGGNFFTSRAQLRDMQYTR
jgi:hypothetical protein